MSIDDKRKLEIARVAHEVNAAYCRSIGDDDIIGWDETTEEHKACLVAGVNQHLEDSEMTPEASHESWLAQKTTDNWILGDEVDHELKTHPLMVPYADVPAEQRVKDHLFKAVVNSMATIPAVEVIEKTVKTEVMRKPVKYIGKRETYTDGLYKTGLTWKKGQVHMVPNDKAIQLLKHADQYELGEVLDEADDPEAAASKTAEAAAKSNDDASSIEEGQVQEAKDMINALQDVDSVKDYVFKTFSGKKMHPRVGLDKAKIQAIQMIDQYGLE